MKKYCVYVLKRNDNNNVFYVGKGLKKRAYEKRNRNEHCTRIMNKYGYYVEIIKWFNEEQLAFDLEKEMIKEIGIDNITNITLGGEGVSGRVPSKSQRKKCSISNKGTSPSEYTLKRATEVNSKKVICLETNKIFNSLTEAAKWISETTGNKKANKTSIYFSCRGKDSNKAYGYSFRYFIDGKIIDNNFEPKVIKTRKVANDRGMKFNKIEDAVLYLRSLGYEKAGSTNIIQSCKHENRKTYGIKWRYIDDN